MDSDTRTLDWKSARSDDIIGALETSRSNGLSSAEAASRLEKYGENRLAEGHRITLFERFLSQFKNVLIYILLFAAVVSGVLGELTDALVIAAIVLLNAVIGVIQESRAEEAISALKALSSPRALVRRDGRTVEVESHTIVPGDVVVLEAGRVVPCDLRLIESANLRVEESSLTGESVPVEQDADALDDP
jgi:Ca2+-transporting ATPase